MRKVERREKKEEGMPKCSGKSRLSSFFCHLPSTSYLLPSIFFLLSSCSRTMPDAGRDDSDILYSKSIRLIKAYADSIRLAPDSVTAMSAFREFNSALDSLNFTVAPNTDLLLTEGENDTLFQEITSLRLQYEKKLYTLAHPLDTITQGESKVPETKK